MGVAQFKSSGKCHWYVDEEKTPRITERFMYQKHYFNHYIAHHDLGLLSSFNFHELFTIHIVYKYVNLLHFMANRREQN